MPNIAIRKTKIEPRRPTGTWLLVTMCCLAGCGRARQPASGFRLLRPSQTGVTFANTVTTNDSENVQRDYFVYNGGGVAIGDIDNDGLPDLFFTGNMVTSRLYLNKGGMRFADITKSAGVTTDRWASGVAMVDINGDGLLDIYVSVSGPEWTPAARRANLLFVNNGDHTFTEEAARYGIADTGFTTQAVFLDYDRDGDLDLFLLGNSPHDFARGAAEIHPGGIPSRSTASYAQFYRNNGDGTFTNVSREAGILRKIGYGLGVVVADVNGDGWPDIYVSNDDTPNDVLYVNNRDGTFTDKAGAWLKHASFAGMGIDIADFNNDGWPDILQTDMLPAPLSERKRMTGALALGTVMDYRRRGFRDDYQINSLQLSNGLTPDGDVMFSDIAQLAGLAYTDWSWSALFADWDNDGYKDILITNGYPKAVNDYDYQRAMFRLQHASEDSSVTHRRERELLKQLRAYRLPNYVFRNNGDLTFADSTTPWGMDQPSFSYGAAYGDLNNDGRLDVVVNNTDAPAFIYEGVRPDNDSSHSLEVRLQGDAPNRAGIGSTLILTAGGHRQYLYQSPYRGYLSSMDDRAHFGLGRVTRVDSLEVIWPDGRSQVLTDVPVDRPLTLRQTDAGSGVRCTEPGCILGDRTPDPAHLPFRRLDARHAPRYFDDVSELVDYDVQPLLPYQISRHGPPLAVADVDGDGLQDVFIGGEAGVPGRLFLQRRGDGGGSRFVESTRGQPWQADKEYEDWGALFFDANGDGRPDLYVASCGYRLSPVSPLLQDRLYINRGGGRFVRDSGALPVMPTCTATVAAGDFTGDGRTDLFVGGRLTPRRYPYPTRSYLLRNDGGRFTDVTADVAPELSRPEGMITAAVWVDFDGDARPDLVTAGEWMPLHFYHNDGGRLRDVTATLGLPPTRGWWYSLAAGDFDHDGHPDLVAGNLGLNFMYATAPQRRFGVYAANFTGNQTTDIVLTQEVDGTEYPFFGLARLGPVIYTLAVRFPSYESFAHASIAQMFSPAALAQAVHYQTDTFASLLLRNDGDGTFSATPLPQLAQLAPVRGIIPEDVDGDGNLDLIVAGNLYETEPNTPRADAANGLWLRGDGRGHFTAIGAARSGFIAPRSVTGLASIRTPAGMAVLVANSGDSLQAFRIARP